MRRINVPAIPNTDAIFHRDDTCGIKLYNQHAFDPCNCTLENIGRSYTHMIARLCGIASTERCSKFTECDKSTNTRNVYYFW
jgi:hypothetical protein